jgi:mRNA-degrading endonuclease RelE of RelBE toxin-antitoxin system
MLVQVERAERAAWVLVNGRSVVRSRSPAPNPRRPGKPLDAPFDEVLSTRRGDYRILYTVDDQTRVVTVLAVAHRRDAYRPR